MLSLDDHRCIAIRKSRLALMTKVKEAIEEAIEESYLLGLSEREIRQDFKRFIDTCYIVIHDNVKDRDVVTGLGESLAREQTCILIADRGDSSEEVAVGQEGGKEQTLVEFSEKVARRKRQILRIIAKYDPQLVRLIDEQRFQGDGGGDEPPRHSICPPSWRGFWKLDGAQLRLQLLKIGYATTIGVIILLIWLGFLEK